MQTSLASNKRRSDLADDSQLSYREIGQTLSIPETTAKTYFYRARKQLHTLLGSEFAYY